MNSYGEQTYYPALQHRRKRSHVGEVMAALLLLLSVLLLLVTSVRALQFRSIVEEGKASKEVEYQSGDTTPVEAEAVETSAKALPTNKVDGI